MHNRYRLPGGEERHIEWLHAGLTGLGVESSTLVLDSNGFASSRLGRVRAGLEMTYRPAGGRAVGMAMAYSKPDVVHFHNIYPLLTPAAVRTAKMAGARVVLTAHNFRLVCPGGTLLRGGEIHDDCVRRSSLVCGLRNSRGRRSESIAYGIALEIQRRFRWLHRWVDTFIVPCVFVRDVLIDGGYPVNKLRVLRNGVPSQRQRLSDLRYGIYVGRLSEEKGIRTLIRAARTVPDIPLMIAGDGPLRALERWAPSNVRFLGCLNANELADLRRRAAFAISPSECYEVCPFSVIEALAAGIPVLATRIGGLPELVEDGMNGVLLEPKQPRQLATAMRRLWDDRPVNELMGERASEAARSELSLDRQLAQLMDLYSEPPRD